MSRRSKCRGISFCLFVYLFIFFFYPQQTFPVSQGLGTSAGLSYTPYLTPMSHSMGLVPTDILPSTPVIVPGSPPVSMTAGSSSNQKLLRTDKLEVIHPIAALCQTGQA